MEDVIQMENNVSMPHFTIMQARENHCMANFSWQVKLTDRKIEKSVTHSVLKERK